MKIFPRLLDGESREQYSARAAADPALIERVPDAGERQLAVLRETARLFGGSVRIETPFTLQRSYQLRAEDLTEDDDTFPVLMATETPVLRTPFWSDPYFEVLLCRAENCELDFIASGRAPVCIDHDLRNQIGVIPSAELVPMPPELRGRMRLSKNNPRAVQERADIKDGIRSAVSAGYMVLDGEFRLSGYDGVPDTLMVTKWRPMEVSTCAIGLDPQAGIGRSKEGETIPKELLQTLRERALRNREEAVAGVSTPKAEETPAPESEARAEDAVQEPIVPTSVSESTTEEEARATSAELAETEVPSEGSPSVPVVEEVSRAAAEAEAGQAAVRVQMELNEALVAERQRATNIATMGRKHNLVAEADAAVASGQSTDEFSRFVLKKIEERQVATSQTVEAQGGIDLKDLRQYSISRAVRQIVGGAWAPGAGLEREVHDHLVRSQGCNPQQAGSVFVPYSIVGQAQRAQQELAGRATSLAASGTGVNLVPQIHGEFQPFLVSSLAFVRAGLRVLTGLRGEVDFPGGDSLGTAGTPGEDASQADSEATFRNYRATPKQVRSRATFSRTLLNNSVPSVDALIEQVLQTRTRTKVESQIMLGTGMSGQLLGIDNKSGVGDADLASNALTYPTALNMITVIDAAKGLIGPASMITSMAVINKGLTTARFGTGSDQGIFGYRPGVTDEWTLDGTTIYRSHEVKKTYPSPSSPSQLIAHGGYMGVFEYSYLCMFGPAMELLVDPFTAAGNGNVVIWIASDLDLAIPLPETIARFDNLLL